MFLDTYIVAKYTFREMIKSKILYNILILGFALLFISYLAYSFTYGVPARMALDFGLGMLTLTSVGMAIFLGVGLVSKEIENRTLYMILSRPLHRSSFFIGKIVGLSSVMLLNIIILAMISLSLYFYLGGEFQSLIGWSIFFSILESFLVLLITVMFSLISNRTLSVIFSISIYTVGHAISGTLVNSFAKSNDIIFNLLKLYYTFFPNFSKLNLKDHVLYDQDLSYFNLSGITLYALIYSLLIIVVSCLIFNRKNLD